jgi:hypothetical protein
LFGLGFDQFCSILSREGKVFLHLSRFTYLFRIAVLLPLENDGYTYIEKFKSYYKYYGVERSFSNGLRHCRLDGTEIFYPESKEEGDMIFNTIVKNRSVNMIFIGIVNYFSDKKYRTIDGKLRVKVYKIFSLR